MRTLLLALLTCFALLCFAQQEAATVPTVASFECLKSGHPYLAPDAVKNVRTWKFADHAPTTFTVTYLYVNQGRFKRDKVTKCAAKMEPGQVTVSTTFLY